MLPGQAKAYLFGERQLVAPGNPTGASFTWQRENHGHDASPVSSNISTDPDRLDSSVKECTRALASIFIDRLTISKHYLETLTLSAPERISRNPSTPRPPSPSPIGQ